jgi:hypothetical protein
MSGTGLGIIATSSVPAVHDALEGAINKRYGNVRVATYKRLAVCASQAEVDGAFRDAQPAYPRVCNVMVCVTEWDGEEVAGVSRIAHWLHALSGCDGRCIIVLMPGPILLARQQVKALDDVFEDLLEKTRTVLRVATSESVLGVAAEAMDGLVDMM